LWTVKIEQHQDANDDNYYIWLYEGSQWKQKLYAAGALLLVIAIVLFPLWPLFLRQGVWYLSMGMLGLIGLFFAMAIVRLIIFMITIFAVPPGLWLYPNLFEDVGFFDSFRPVWARGTFFPLDFYELKADNPRPLKMSRQRRLPRRRRRLRN
jgi:translocation protein SEC62